MGGLRGVGWVDGGKGGRAKVGSTEAWHCSPAAFPPATPSLILLVLPDADQPDTASQMTPATRQLPKHHAQPPNAQLPTRR